MLTRVHHVGLVVRRLEDGLAFWQDVLGLRVAKQATVQDQGVRAALLPIGRSEIELLEPVDPAGGVAKFLERRGEGLHHICFLHPKGTRGVLVEFATPPPGEHAPAGPGPLAGLALREVTARSRDATSAAELFATQLGLARGAAVGAAGITAAAVRRRRPSAVR